MQVCSSSFLKKTKNKFGAMAPKYTIGFQISLGYVFVYVDSFHPNCVDFFLVSLEWL